MEKSCISIYRGRGIHETLLKDELLSSWLMRTAFDFSCDPLILTGVVWPGWRVWTIDRDRYLEQGRMDQLTQYFDLPSNYFQPALLETYIQRVTLRPLPKKGAWPWLLSYGCRNRNSVGGIQFCPICFATDPIPYFRYFWRFSWSVTCLVHQCKLIDRCQKCSKPIEFKLSKGQDFNYMQCQSCGFKLLESASEPSDTGFSLQTRLNSFYRIGSGSCFGQDVDTYEAFIFIRIMIGFARRASRNNTNKQAQFLKQCGVQENQLLPTQSTLSFECLPTIERNRLLSISNTVINMDIKDLRIAIKECSIMDHHLTFAHSEVSTIFKDILHVPAAPQRVKRVATNSHKESVRSKASVLSMEARLLRRARLWKP